MPQAIRNLRCLHALRGWTSDVFPDRIIHGGANVQKLSSAYKIFELAFQVINSLFVGNSPADEILRNLTYRDVYLALQSDSLGYNQSYRVW